MDKKEQIERALGEYLWSSGLIVGYETLAKQAIVIECEVIHSYPPQTGISVPILDDHHGTPGKAIAIIVPSEKP